MNFVALLTKELRLRLRRERTIWVIIAYLLLMGLLGWVFINAANSTVNYAQGGLSSVGTNLYYMLSVLQLFLIIFISPAFTATTVNGEKERQTFDLLLCSRLSAFSLVSGKLLAGLANALLLIAASIPLFSLVFFFGGVSPGQVLGALLVYLVTVLLVGTLGMFCSILFRRPAVSTAVSYMASLFWIILPLVITFILFSLGGARVFQLYPNRIRLLYSWNPVIALISTYFWYGGDPNSMSYAFGFSYVGPFSLGQVKVMPWVLYCLLNLLVALILFGLSVMFVRPNALKRHS